MSLGIQPGTFSSSESRFKAFLFKCGWLQDDAVSVFLFLLVDFAAVVVVVVVVDARLRRLVRKFVRTFVRTVAGRLFRRFGLPDSGDVRRLAFEALVDAVVVVVDEVRRCVLVAEVFDAVVGLRRRN